ncbi:hypothetical protein H1V43_32390 [Streptomyces sp. PSKA54]|uniref:HNH endonuclease n=1 Tax=Streptomyces himalayensis subsp. aureolus TaxID=2758039 RepID=A0A7W2HJD5_9ACTN|nr:hypothetical protein [Streptomyces himalayensis]MBA4865963.1 hypothetical protein [Streptomyces himalayensis subsp. aureolus]
MSRAQIVELLRAGGTDRGIERETGVPKRQVRKIRIEQGIAPHKPGNPLAGQSLEDAFWRRVQPTDDGHLLWPHYKPGRPCLIKWRNSNRSAHKIAFGIAHDREPVGRVRTGCGIPGCVHPRHVDDQAMRNQYVSIFGRTP